MTKAAQGATMVIKWMNRILLAGFTGAISRRIQRATHSLLTSLKGILRFRIPFLSIERAICRAAICNYLRRETGKSFARRARSLLKAFWGGGGRSPRSQRNERQRDYRENGSHAHRDTSGESIIGS